LQEFEQKKIREMKFMLHLNAKKYMQQQAQE